MAAAERYGEWRGGAELRCCRCLRGGESERESEVGSTARSAYEGERVEGEAGRLRRAASFAGAWRPRGVRALSPVGHGVGEPASERAGQHGGRPGRHRELGRKRGGGP